ncbi:hypothetical protein P879_06740 [Paragonimus westermani]|uniref:Uncharacterized protein n=1 Tax=Paragonimus westermani TaxID=34504 RepID=A0A8T0DU60_9TREM|nr:hypothetical protein P879_06740 [Paragonimus westermani]
MCGECPLSQFTRLGNWEAWSARILSEPEIKDALRFSQRGARSRHRECDNPPPELPPSGVPCSGPSRQTAWCGYKYGEKPFSRPAIVMKQIDLRVDRDYRTGLKLFKRVQKRKVGERTAMSFDTPAYRYAKLLTAIAESTAARRGLHSEQLQVTWFRCTDQDSVGKILILHNGMKSVR